MPSVLDVILSKGTVVHSISPDATVLEAIQKMNQHKIGALLVMEGHKVSGIFTERDVLRRVIAEERNVRDVKVADVMTCDVICASHDTDLEEVSSIMQSRRIRHVPVCDDDGQIKGMISIGDVNAHHVTTQELQINFLSDYIYGRA